MAVPGVPCLTSLGVPATVVSTRSFLLARSSSRELGGRFVVDWALPSREASAARRLAALTNGGVGARAVGATVDRPFGV